MKVLQVINRMIRGGGAEKFSLDLTLALNKVDGVEVEVLSITHPTNNDFVDILEKNGISHSVLSDSLYSLRNVFRLKNFIEKRKYDVVHVHLFPSLYYASLARIMSRKQCLLVYTEHSTNNKRRGNPLFQVFDKIIYRQYDTIVGISEKVKSNLEKHIKSDSVIVINNGVDIKAIEDAKTNNIKEELGLEENVTVITMVSRITEGKDYNTLINAIQLLPSNIHVVFVGNGPLFEDLKRRKNSSSAKERIHILGLRKDVYGLLKSSDIIVLSTHHEGFSIAMLEAMGAHKPFVASAVEGIKDIVEDVAVLFEYKDSVALANILETLYLDKEYYNQIADRCYCFAQEYDINKVAKNYLSIYSK